METDNATETLKDNSLRTAGWAYLIGDAAMFASGLFKHDRDWHEMATGAWWALGGAAAARYGNPDAEKQLELLGRKLGDHLRNIGVTIPDNPTTHALAKPGGIIDHIESFLYTYPSQALNAIYAIGGIEYIRSGIQKNNHWNTASGVLVIAGALAGLLISEKKPDPAHPPESVIGKAWAWFQEKPLRMSGAFYMANNATTVMSAIHDRSKGQNAGMLKIVTSATYLFANYMLSLSSKEQGDNKKENIEALERLGTMTARVVAAQPKELQEALVDDISHFLAKQPQAQHNPGQIAALLRDKLAKTSETLLTAKNWVQRSTQPASPTSPAL